MRCAEVGRRLSAWLDGDLPPAAAGVIDSHVAECPSCRTRAAELREVSRLVGDLPRLEASEPVAQALLTRLEVETRGPGLGLLLRRFGAARPFIVPSLVPAALVLVTVLAATLALDSGPRLSGRFATWGAVPALGTESNPHFLSAGVGLPRAREGGALAPDVLLGAAGEDALFVETVVARDGTVSTVTVLQGDAEHAAPLLAALRQQRFEPARYRGRPVAVSVYRLISSMDVSFPAL
jgi:anti-sigma factor RsiW